MDLFKIVSAESCEKLVRKINKSVNDGFMPVWETYRVLDTGLYEVIIRSCV